MSLFFFLSHEQRQLGKQILFPFGFHCTGMPIVACADRLAKEIQQFGNPPVFPPEPEEAEQDEEQPEEGKAPGQKNEEDKKKRKKAKTAAKTSKAKYQWEIMREMGVPEAEISKFAEATHWLRHFPPIGQADLENFGLAADFRRSFITTDVNPYYDAFIRWQLNTLHRQGRLSYGSRYAIWSPVDNQPCADHDRASGEGVGYTEYTLVHLKLQQPYPEALQRILDAAGAAGKQVLLPAATLRPETMYGQTNLFMLPTGEYGVYTLSQDQVIVCSDRSALNLSWQQGMLCPAPGKPEKLGSILVRPRELDACFPWMMPAVLLSLFVCFCSAKVSDRSIARTRQFPCPRAANWNQTDKKSEIDCFLFQCRQTVHRIPSFRLVRSHAHTRTRALNLGCRGRAGLRVHGLPGHGAPLQVRDGPHPAPADDQDEQGHRRRDLRPLGCPG